MNNIPPDVIYIYTVYNLKSIGKNVRFFYKKTYRVILQNYLYFCINAARVIPILG